MKKIVLIAALLLAGCGERRPATEGSGYQFVRLVTPAAIRAVAADPGGEALNSNNKTCLEDPGCRK